MPVKSDTWIIQQAAKGMIAPFEAGQVKEAALPAGLKKLVSYGTSSYGYDMRLDRVFRVLKPGARGELDPKRIDDALFDDVTVQDSLVLPPHSFALAQTVEYFRIPRDILTICFGKSTYARCGVFVNVTPFEPEWEGRATIAVNNLTPLPVRLHAGEGIAQLLFLQSDEVCAVSYRDKKGKYQAQQEPTAAKV